MERVLAQTVIAVGSFVLWWGSLVPSAQAYRTFADENGGSHALVFATPTVQIEFYGEPPPGLTGFSSGEDLAEAVNAWRAECSGLEFSPVMGSSDRPPSPEDGVITISVVQSGWTEMGFRESQAAVTDVRAIVIGASVQITDADIFVNGETIDWGAREAPRFRAVLAHELGHAFGLAHPCEHDPAPGEAPRCDLAIEVFSASLMFPDYRHDHWSPQPDDIEGLCALHPPLAIDPCESIRCAGTDVCRAGVCVGVSVCASGDICPDGVCASHGMLAGECVGEGNEGAPCRTGNDCDSRLCLTSMRLGSYCTRSCSHAADCPGVQQCSAVDGANVCSPVAASNCSAGRASPISVWILIFGAVLVGLRRRGK